MYPVQVVDVVADRIPEIVQRGVPIPDHIPFNLDNVIPDPSKLSQGAVQLGAFIAATTALALLAAMPVPDFEPEATCLLLLPRECRCRPGAVYGTTSGRDVKTCK